MAVAAVIVVMVEPSAVIRRHQQPIHDPAQEQKAGPRRLLHFSVRVERADKHAGAVVRKVEVEWQVVLRTVVGSGWVGLDWAGLGWVGLMSHAGGVV